MTEEFERKMLLHARIRTALLVAILALLLVATISIVGGMRDIQSTTGLMQEKLQALDTEEINRIVDAIHNVADELDALELSELGGTIKLLNQAADTLGSVNMDTMNQAVGSLKDAANKLKDIDVDALNALITSLEGTAERLQSVTDVFSILFKK